MKTTTDAKQRLSAALGPAERQKLALAMFHDVLSTLTQTRGLAGIMVVTVDTAVAALAEKAGARILADGARAGHTGAVTAGIRTLLSEGRAGVLSVPGDIPLVTAAEIETVIGAHPEGRAFSINPAHDGRGSNAVLLTPPDAMPLAFGNDSHLPHVAQARHLGLSIATHHLSGIALDIDTPDDLVAFRRTARDTHTARLLAAFGAA